jgi:CRP-like cAMP-binding protein
VVRSRSLQQDRLRTCALFADCSAHECNVIDRLSVDVVVSAGRKICCEGLTRPQFVVVFDGVVELSRAGRRITILGPGAWFGHVALVGHQPAEQVSGVVLSASARLLVFSSQEFRSLLRAVPSVAEIVGRSAPGSDSPRARSHEALDVLPTGSAPRNIDAHAAARGRGRLATALG